MKEELSPITGKPMILVWETDTAKYRGEIFNYTHWAYWCVDSGEQYTTDELDELNSNQVFDAYRERHGYPYPHEIMKLRERYGVSTQLMSIILGFDKDLWRYFETGKVPSDADMKSIVALQDKSNFLDYLDRARALIGNEEYSRIRNTLTRD